MTPHPARSSMPPASARRLGAVALLLAHAWVVSPARGQTPAADSVRALLGQGDAAWAQGTEAGVAQADAAWREALRRAARIGAASLEAAAAIRIGVGQQRLGRTDSADSYLRRGRDRSRQVPDTLLEAGAERWLAQLLRDSRQLDSAQAAAARAVALLGARPPSADLAHALLVRSDVALERPPRDSARRFARQAIGVARQLNDSALMALGFSRVGYAWEGDRRPDSAAAAFLAAAEAAPDPRLWRGGDHPLAHAALHLASTGQRDAARQQLRRLGALQRAAGDTLDPTGAFAFVQAGMRGRDQGTAEGLADAWGNWEAALVLAELGGDRPLQALVLRLLADRFAAAGQLDSATTLLRQTADLQLQLGDTAGAAKAYNDLGWAHVTLRQADTAIPPLQRARDLFRATGNRERLTSALDGLGRAYGLLERGADAGAALAESARLLIVLGDTAQALVDWENAGNMYYRARQLPAAAAAYRAEAALARARRDGRRAGQALARVGAIEEKRFAFDSALVAYRASLPLLRAVGDSAWELAVQRGMGIAYYRVTQMDSSVAALRRAISLAAALGDSSALAGAHNDIGTTFDEMRRADSALAHFRLSLPMALAARRYGEAGTTSTNIGNILSHRPETRDSALWYYRQGLSLQLQAGDTANAGVTLGNIGSWFHPARPDSSLTYYRRALAFRRAARDPAGEAVILSKLGQVLEFTGQADSARKTYAAALTGLRAVGARGYEFIVLADLAHLYHRNPTLRNLSRAVAYYDTAMTLAATIAASAGGDADRVVYREAGTSVVEDWALAWAARVRDGVEPGIAARAALGAAERGRAQALLELMGGGSPAVPVTDALSDAMLDLTRVTARPGTALAVYLVTRDTLMVWLTAPGGERGTLLTLGIPRSSLAAQVAEYREALGVGGGAAAGRLSPRAVPLEARERTGAAGAAGAGSAGRADSAATALANSVFGPLFARYLPGVRELVIVPHGPLALVPFGALTVPGDTLPLGLRLGVRYAPSLAVLSAAESRAGAPGDRPPPGGWPGMLVVGNPAMPQLTDANGEERTLSELPGAGVEGRWVGERLTVPALTGPAASEAAIRAALPRAPLVHLATHGYAYASEAASRRSFVALAPGGGQDGLFTVGELLDDPGLTLTAELVVLSACQTGLGDLKEAEGTVGLQRAFLARGAKSVLVSLWNVSDDATALLMQRFYTHWLDDADRPSRAEALRRAQADVRARPEYRSPTYWAPFQLVGAG